MAARSMGFVGRSDMGVLLSQKLLALSYWLLAIHQAISGQPYRAGQFPPAQS